MKIDISKLDKADVLAALYNRAMPQGMGMLHFDPAPMTREQAQALLDTRGTRYFDYLQGRVMKVSLEGDELDARLYDRDNGEGAAAEAISALLP
jgi:hypothetical protein